MRRADRLFRIVEYLKARRTVVRAQDLADLLEVSLRTIYRDMADLMTSGTPIIGEAGTGYVLDKHYLVKPLMFDVEELEALALGAQMVQSWSDPSLTKSAHTALDKIHATLPSDLSNSLLDEVLFSFSPQARPIIKVDFTSIRRAIHTRHKVAFHYYNEKQEPTRRTVRPLALAFFAPVWVLLGWCEKRNDFRNFRLDRISDLIIMDVVFYQENGKTLDDFKKQESERNA